MELDIPNDSFIIQLQVDILININPVTYSTSIILRCIGGWVAIHLILEGKSVIRHGKSTFVLHLFEQGTQLQWLEEWDRRQSPGAGQLSQGQNQGTCRRAGETFMKLF